MSAMRRRADLAEFLRARRAALRPEDVGLTPGERRRTAGLRREEVATLAGVSVSWYTWIEQGRAGTVTAGCGSWGHFVPPAAHCVKKRRSATSRSSPTTKPSVDQPRRVSVQRRMVDASKPTSSAIQNAAMPCAEAEAPSKASAVATAAVTTT